MTLTPRKIQSTYHSHETGSHDDRIGMTIRDREAQIRDERWRHDHLPSRHTPLPRDAGMGMPSDDRHLDDWHPNGTHRL